MIAWCNGYLMDIYEVFNEEDFQNCINLSEHPTHYSNDYDIEGFVLRQPTMGIQTRGFVSKTRCKDGFKVKVTWNCQ